MNHLSAQSMSRAVREQLVDPPFVGRVLAVFARACVVASSRELSGACDWGQPSMPITSNAMASQQTVKTVARTDMHKYLGKRKDALQAGTKEHLRLRPCQRSSARLSIVWPSPSTTAAKAP